jgi:uncharacterized lipoprotein YmbA
MLKKYLILTFVLLNACSWRSPNADFYTLNSRDLTPLSAKTLNVAVTKVVTPDILNRQQMVTYEENGNRINILEFNRWGENLPYVLQNAVTNDLIAYLPNSFVKRAEYGSDKMKYNVRIEINEIMAYQGKKVVLSAWWTVENADGEALMRKQVKFEAPALGESIGDLVAAQNKAVNMLSKDIAENLLKL